MWQPPRTQPPCEWAPKYGTVHKIAGQTLCENPYPPPNIENCGVALYQKIKISCHDLFNLSPDL